MKRLISISLFMFFVLSIGFTSFDRTPINVSEAPDHKCLIPRMAIDKWGNVHIVWEEYLTESNNEVFYRKLTSKGWSEKINVSNNKWPSREPSIAVDEKGNAYVVWLDTFNTSGFRFSVAFREISKNGTMGETKNALPQPGSNFRLPSIASSPEGNLSIIAYTQNYNVYGVSRDNGVWSSPKTLQRRIARFAGESAYVSWGEDGKFHAVWPEYSPGSDQAMTVYYTSREVGKEWNVPDVVNATGDAQGHPRILVEEDGTIHVTWMDEEGSSFQIIYEKWDPSKKKWATPEIVSGDGQLGNLPTITLTKNKEVYISYTVGAWGHLKNAFYSFKDVNGVWNKASSVLPTTINNPYFTDIKSGGPNDNVFLVYENAIKQDGGKEIFLVTKKPPEFSATVEEPLNVSAIKVASAKINPYWDSDYYLITWKENPDNEKNKITIKFYNVYRKLENSSNYSKIGEVNADTYSYLDTNFNHNKTYVYGVSAVDDKGNESSINFSKN